MDRQQTWTGTSWEPLLQTLLRSFLDHTTNWGKHESKFLCQNRVGKRHFRMYRQQLPLRAAARTGTWAKSLVVWIFFDLFTVPSRKKKWAADLHTDSSLAQWLSDWEPCPTGKKKVKTLQDKKSNHAVTIAKIVHNPTSAKLNRQLGQAE